MNFFQRQPTPAPNSVPPQFKWVAVKMEVTTWLITITLSMIGLGVWSAGHQLKDLVNAVGAIKANDEKQDLTNYKQSNKIQELELALAKHQGYLERILDAVESNGRKIP